MGLCFSCSSNEKKASRENLGESASLEDKALAAFAGRRAGSGEVSEVSSAEPSLLLWFLGLLHS